jgi:uncharacterized membrane protein
MIRLRNLFIAGLMVLIPIVLTAWILQLLFNFLDDFSQPLLALYLGRDVWGVGAMLTALIILTLGYFSTLFVGQRIVEAFEYWIARVPIVRSVYSTTRQVVRGFSTGDGMNFQRPVLIAKAPGTYTFGFVTGEFSVQRASAAAPMVSVYVPTNHLYLGDVFLVESERVVEVNLTLEEGISAVLSCGGSLPAEVIMGLGASSPADRGVAQLGAESSSSQK